MKTNIIIAGDFCPKDRVLNILEDKKYGEIFDEVKPIIERADYAIVNLEAPIVIGEGSPIKKSGPNLKCGPNVVEAIKYAGFKGVTLANNHFLDYGQSGANTTISLLNNANIDYVGAGKEVESAKQIIYKIINEKKFAIINCCEHEFSVIDDPDKIGCNGLDTINLYHTIKEAKEIADYVIVIVHGGIEMYQLPTPQMIKTYRFFVDAGADVVINHHQHCFSGYEVYKSKPIVYGLGNFCFDWYGKRNSIWNEGYMVNLSFDENKEISIEIIPYIQCNENPIISISSVNKDQFNTRLAKLSHIINNDQELSNQYEILLKGTWKNYDMINPWQNRYLRYAYKKGFIPSLISQKKILSILNAVRCESHKDRLIHTLIKKSGINKNH